MTPKGEAEAIKQCIGCDQLLQLDSFHKKPGTKDGRQSFCKSCACENTKRYNRVNKEQVKQKSKQRYQQNKDKIAQERKQYYQKNKSQIKQQKKKYEAQNKERLKKYRQENKERIKQRHLKTRYGISLEQYNEMLKSQNSQCAICRTHQSTLKTCLAVDHCHKTNQIRGILCSSCNTGIGHLKDDIKILEKAILYLKEHNQEEV